jgi:hypothetical protein
VRELHALRAAAADDDDEDDDDDDAAGHGTGHADATAAIEAGKGVESGAGARKYAAAGAAGAGVAGGKGAWAGAGNARGGAEGVSAAELGRRLDGLAEQIVRPLQARDSDASEARTGLDVRLTCAPGWHARCLPGDSDMEHGLGCSGSPATRGRGHLLRIRTRIYTDSGRLEPGPRPASGSPRPRTRRHGWAGQTRMGRARAGSHLLGRPPALAMGGVRLPAPVPSDPVQEPAGPARPGRL